MVGVRGGLDGVARNDLTGVARDDLIGVVHRDLVAVVLSCCSSEASVLRSASI